jgi:prepilin-type N-terminal cleavage/methylation domain-containing protein
MRSRGFSLVEMLVVVALSLTMAAVALPVFRAMSADSQLMSAGLQFKAHFRLAASRAVASNAYTAIRFETRPSGQVWYSIYRDGNSNGVLSADIERGHDVRIAGPFPLTAGAPGVRVGINPGTPAVPPDSGQLSGNPIRFGNSGMLSFSPLGTATPGTFYLAGDSAQAAVRVTGGTARVRLMVCRGGVWRER